MTAGFRFDLNIIWVFFAPSFAANSMSRIISALVLRNLLVSSRSLSGSISPTIGVRLVRCVFPQRSETLYRAP